VSDPPPSDFVLLGVPDVNGSIRGKAFRPAAFESSLRDGVAQTDLLLALDPVDIPISDYEAFGIRAGASDLVVRPEPETLHEMHWRPGWRICLGTPYWANGSVCEYASREVLRAALEGPARLGYRVLAAFEYEIRIRDGEGRPLSSGISYSASEIQRFGTFVDRLVPALDAMGVELTAVHTEAGPGLLELNLAPRYGLEAADNAALLKFAVKEVATSAGLTASFLAKPAAGEEGSSGHIHFSFWGESGNAFAASPDGDLPATVRGAVGGTLEHLAAASLLLNPTINSYKRLVPGFFAPVNASWGLDNRSAAVRVIRSNDAGKCRIECRRPGADANPYLALAALVASAADGIARGAEPPPLVSGDAYARADLPALPGSLEAALVAFEADAPFRRLLGDRFSAYYAVSRRWELKAWQQVVTDWERERYERAV